MKKILLLYLFYDLFLYSKPSRVIYIRMIEIHVHLTSFKFNFHENKTFYYFPPDLFSNIYNILFEHSSVQKLTNFRSILLSTIFQLLLFSKTKKFYKLFTAYISNYLSMPNIHVLDLNLKPKSRLSKPRLTFLRFVSNFRFDHGSLLIG